MIVPISVSPGVVLLFHFSTMRWFSFAFSAYIQQFLIECWAEQCTGQKKLRYLLFTHGNWHTYSSVKYMQFSQFRHELNSVSILLLLQLPTAHHRFQILLLVDYHCLVLKVRDEELEIFFSIVFFSVSVFDHSCTPLPQRDDSPCSWPSSSRKLLFVM